MQTILNSRRISKPLETVDIKLQAKLIDVWTDHCIPQFYEHLFLNYIKRIPVSQAEAQIKEEIKQIERYESFVQFFIKALREKTKIEEFVALSINNEKRKNIEIDFPHFCQCISQLRDANYRAAFFLCKIHQKYEDFDDANKSPEKLFFNNFSIKIDKFRKTLAKSLINKYIILQDEYDPFFISIKKQGSPIYHNNVAAVQQLFTIPLHSSYNFLKMKRILLGWLPYNERRKDLDKKDFLPYLEFNRHADITLNKHETKERSLDLQKIKQEIREEFDYIKRNHSPSYFELSQNKIDANKTRYFKSSPRKDADRLIKINKMFNSYGNQPELVSKNYGEDHFNVLMNAPFQMPSRKERRSEDIGRIKRSRVSQLTSNISSYQFKSKNSRLASQNTQCIADNTIFHRHQRLQSMNYIPKKTSLHSNTQHTEEIYQRSKRPNRKSYSNSRQLENSLMINIMISPMKDRNSGRQRSSGRSLDKEKDKSSISSLEANTPQRKESIVHLYNKELSNETKPNDAIKKTKNVEEALSINKQQISLSNQRQNTINRQKPSPMVLKSSQRQENYADSTGSKEPLLMKSQNPSELYSTVNKKTQEGQANNLSMSNSTANNLTYRANHYNPPLKSEANIASPLTNEQLATSKAQTSATQPKYASKNQIIEEKGQNTSTFPNPVKKSQPKTQQPDYKINVIPSSKPKESIEARLTESLKVTEQKISPQAKQNLQGKTTVQSSKSLNQTQQKIQIKIKIGKMTYDSLVQYIKTYDIHSQYQNKYDFNKILKETQYQQTYLTQFTINNQPRALALSSLVPPNSNFAIRLWIIHKAIDQNLSIILFKKYIELVQKYITAPVIFFKGEEMQEIKSLSFQFKKEKLYSKGRTTKPREIQRQFQNFLNCQCSHINFQQKQKEDILFSQQIEIFNESNSLAADYLFRIESASAPQKLNFLLNIHKSVPNFVKVNKILSDQDLDGYEVNKSITIQSIDLLNFAYHTQVKVPFVACDGFFKFYGIEAISSALTNLYFINLTKNNGKMYFGRGFSSILAFSKSLSSESAKRGCFSVPMFTKNLYGRYTKVSEKQKGYYGNWQFSLVWQDEMQGRLKHTTEKGFSFINQPFYVGLQIEGNLLYCFQVIKEDFLF